MPAKEIQKQHKTRYTEEKLHKTLEEMKSGFSAQQILTESVNQNYASLEDMQRIEDKIDKLSRKIDLIFGEAVLLDGNFVSLKS